MNVGDTNTQYITTGSAGNKHYQYRITTTCNSSSVANGTYNVTISVDIIGLSGWYYNNASAKVYCNLYNGVGGSTGNSSSITSVSTSNWTNVINGNWNIPVDVNGNLSIQPYIVISSNGLSYTPLSGTWYISSIIFNNLPRRSIIITQPDTNIFLDSNPNVGVPFNISINKYISSAYQKLEMQFHGDGGIQNRVSIFREDFNGGNITLTSEELTSLYTIRKNSNELFFPIFKLFTYTDSSMTTQIGESSNISVNASFSPVEPNFDENNLKIDVTLFANVDNYVYKGLSNVKCTINANATGNKLANISSYSIESTGLSSVNYLGTQTFPVSNNFEKVTSPTITLKIIDSRGNQKIINKQLNFKDYNLPIISNFETKRLDDVEEETKLNANGTFNYYQYIEIGSDTPTKDTTNTIYEVKYRYAIKGTNNFSEWFEIPYLSISKDNINQTWEINNFAVGNLPTGNVYDFELSIIDLFGSMVSLQPVISSYQMNSATPTIWVDHGNGTVGFGMKPNSNNEKGSGQFNNIYFKSDDGTMIPLFEEIT